MRHFEISFANGLRSSHTGILTEMSEYQYIEFIAIDAPVSDKDLEYMDRQSTRAEITNWRFTNE